MLQNSPMSIYKFKICPGVMTSGLPLRVGGIEELRGNGYGKGREVGRGRGWEGKVCVMGFGEDGHTCCIVGRI